MEKMQNKFIEMATKLEVEHFKQIEKHSANLQNSMELQTIKQFEAMDKQTRALVEILKPQGSLDTGSIENKIEEEDTEPTDEMPPMDLQGTSIKFEGEEKILPINIET